jgi:hypothetical protein
MLPTILMVWPHVVVTNSLKVTATEVAARHPVEVVEVFVEVTVVVEAVPVAVPVVVEVVMLVLGFWDVGNDVDVAEEYDPTTEVAEQVPGTDVAEDWIQPAGITPARRAAAVKKAAYDQVRSWAERGWPLLLENCSEREPFA